MSQDHLLVLSTIAGGVLALVAAAFLLLFGGTSDQEVARRIGSLRQGAEVSRAKSSRFLPALISLAHHLGDAMRDRMLSARDAEALGKSLTAAGLEPSKAVPIFISAKISGLFLIPALVYLGTVLLGYPTSKQALYSGLSLVVALMAPNWVLTLIRRPYQQNLRRGIPDALDLMVVCAEAGLGLESAVARVANEMKQSNRPVGVEFSLLMHEMRIYPDRRIALTNLSERTGQPALKRLAGTIMQTLKYGTPLSQGLRTLAAEMRAERMIQFEERAGKLPALLVVPMILCILPALFIVLMGQPVTRMMASLATMMHH
jgi:tight adherence protein C